MTGGKKRKTSKKVVKKPTKRKKAAKKTTKKKAVSKPEGKKTATPPPDDPLVSVREAARRLGVSHTAVQKAIEQGRLVASISPRANGRGFLVDASLAAEEWEKNTDPSQTRRGTAQAPKKTPPRKMPLFDDAESNDETEPPAGDEINKDGYLDSRARREHFRAKAEEMEFRRKAGELVERREEEQAGFEIARTCRDRLVLMADTLAPKLVGKSDLRELRKLILEATTEACQALFDRFDPDREPG